MPKGQTRVRALPDTVKVVYLSGEPFIAIKAAARLAGIHPAVLEMAQRLTKKPGTEAGLFELATVELRSKATEIEAVFVSGLRKAARALVGPGKLTVRSHREGNRLTFWYDAV